MTKVKAISMNPRVKNPDHLESNQRFISWISQNLPDKNFTFGMTDIDLCIYDRFKKRFMCIEIKCRRAECGTAQGDFFRMLGLRLKHIDSIYQDQPDIADGWKYYGFVLIQFETGIFDGGQIFVNRNAVTETQLKKILSFREPPPLPI
jgi:hypothetical protein